MDDSAGKTTVNDSDVSAFVSSITDDDRRRDAEALVTLMQDVTRESPVMWGAAIIGFGSRHYRYPSGREGDTVAVGFAPRKAQSVLYLTGELEDYHDLLGQLGPHTTGKGCLYVRHVEKVDDGALREIVARSYRTGTGNELASPPSTSGEQPDGG